MTEIGMNHVVKSDGSKMKIKLKMISSANYMACTELKVSAEQEDFVAPNLFSLVQAAYEPDMYPLGIYKADQMVGFILYDFDTEITGWSMSRFMIDQRYQNQGIGSTALATFIDYFHAKHGCLPLYTSAIVDNIATIALYERFGFEKGDVSEYKYGGKQYKELGMVLKKGDYNHE